MPIDPIREQQLIDAIQTAAPLADRVRVASQQLADDAVTLDAAIDRAVRTLKSLQPPEQDR